MRTRHIVGLVGFAVVTLAGCELITTPDRTKLDPQTTSSGTTSSSSSSSSASTGGGAPCSDPATDCPPSDSKCVVPTCLPDGSCGVMNADDGATCNDAGGKVCDTGKCVECHAPTDCPAAANECETATCKSQKCGFDFVGDGIATVSGQTTGDCKQQVCDGAGMTKVVDDNNDPLDDMNECTVDACAGGQNMPTNAALGATCTVGGKSCGGGTKAGQCVECTKDGDCSGSSPHCDTTNDNFKCVPASCSDGTINGTETDTDCGGGVCGACANTKTCAMATDCTSGFCNAVNKCAPCAGDGDCPSNQFCGNGVCKPDQGNGGTCTTTSQCTSGNCVDGFCCDTSCTSNCQACSAAKKGQGLDGVCGNVKSGADPDNNCPAASQTSCGNSGGCDGSGGCTKYAAGTPCSASACTGDTSTPADLCDGNGTCVDSGMTSCAPYNCNALTQTCKTSCTTSLLDCDSGFYCDSGNCLPQITQGQTCTGVAGECAGNDQCVDGVCCNTGCGGTCQACNIAGSLGTCTNVPAGGTDGGCAGNNECNGSGGCLEKNGEVCTLGIQCVTGNCVDGVCCDTACAGTCVACTATKKGSGNDGACGAIAAGTDPDNECPTNNDYSCNGSSACESCYDNVKNGGPTGETDTDCGGFSGCPRCPATKACKVNNDCASNSCTNLVCD